MSAVTDFFSWLFDSRMGVICLIVGGMLLFVLISWLLERRTRQEYFNHERTEGDWSLFDDESGWSDFEDDNK